MLNVHTFDFKCNKKRSMQTNAVQMRNTSLSCCKSSWWPLQYRKYTAEHCRCNSSEQAQARYLATITIRLPGQELHRRQHDCRTRRGGGEEHFQQRLAHRLGLDSSNALRPRLWLAGTSPSATICKRGNEVLLAATAVGPRDIHPLVSWSSEVLVQLVATKQRYISMFYKY